MGSFDQGFMFGGQLAQQNTARSRQLQDEQRQQNLQRNWGILNDPNAAPEAKQAAGQSIQDQYPTPEHKGTFLSDVFHLHSKQPSAQPVPVALPPSAPSPIAVNDEGASGLDSTAPSPSAAPSASPGPSSPASPNLRAVAAAPTPQAAMNLWQQYRGPVAVNEGVAEDRAKNAAGFAQKLADTNNAARIQEAQIRAHGNVSMQKMDAAAQSLGAEDFASASPEIKMQAMKSMATANRAPAWKAVTDGNTIYAVNSLDPTQRTPLGHKDDLTQRQEFKTMSNPDGSTFLVPMTVWTKKGSSTPIMETHDDQANAPVSTNTPQGPASAAPAASQGGSPATPVSSATPQGAPGAPSASPNPGARQPGTKPAGGAVRTASRIPSSSVGTPIPFGGKPNELTKSDTSQYTKLAEDANAKQEALQLAQNAARSPSPSSDQQLIYSWVRANVQGAGRMTQQEFNRAARIGSLPQKASNWYSLATSGKMTPEIRQMLLSDIRGAASNSQQMAKDARAQVDQDMHPGNSPTSAKTPGGPGAWSAPKDAPAPTKPNQVLRANGQVIARSLDGKTWSQP